MRDNDHKKKFLAGGEQLPAAGTGPQVATIGSFDGVHRGHLFVLGQVVSLARERKMEAVAITFGGHPRQVLHPDMRMQLLTLPEEKRDLMGRAGVDRVVMLDFTEELAQMTARHFMLTVLRQRMNVRVLFMGYDNHFGHDRKGFDDCRRYGLEMGIEVVGGEVCPEGESISSTAIRLALLHGDVRTANNLLGRPYAMQGTVVRGFGNGHKLGYPTANLQVDDEKLLPENGVYLVGTDHGYGMLNIGTRPTLHNGTRRSIEVHIFDFSGDIYDSPLTVTLLDHLRREQEFSSLNDLQHQLAADEQECKLRIEKLKN